MPRANDILNVNTAVWSSRKQNHVVAIAAVTIPAAMCSLVRSLSYRFLIRTFQAANCRRDCCPSLKFLDHSPLRRRFLRVEAIRPAPACRSLSLPRCRSRWSNERERCQRSLASFQIQIQNSSRGREGRKEGRKGIRAIKAKRD